MSFTLPDITAAIGHTPVIELSRLVRHRRAKGRIYAKLEYLNPGFSKKDRIALQIILEAERQGVLSPGQVVVELTSGNTGTGLAIVCAAKGYRFIAVMSKGNSPERARMMRALGAEVVLVDQAPGSIVGEVSGEDLALVEAETTRLVQELKAFRADQFFNPANALAHELTGEEIWEQTQGDITAFVDYAGTGGTFAGVSAALKKHNQTIKCYLVEPDTAARLSGRKVTNTSHKIQGGGYNMDLPLLNKEHIDGYLSVTDDEAIATARDLAKFEGVFAGFSSGANVAAALGLLQHQHMGGSIAVLINDSGLKYLSTELY